MELAATAGAFAAAHATGIGLAASAIGTAASVAGTIAGGNAAKSSADFQAAQARQQAGQAAAGSQRVMQQKLRETQLASSRLQALSAADGGSATDPTVETLNNQITGQGEFNALTALFNGDERARGLNTQANALTMQGSQAQGAGYMKGFTTLAAQGGSLYSKYNDLPSSPADDYTTNPSIDKYN